MSTLISKISGYILDKKHLLDCFTLRIHDEWGEHPLKIARGKSGLQSIETPWLESLGRLNTDTSRRTLLSFIDPDTLRRRQSRLRPSQRGNLCGVRRRRGTRGFRTQAEAPRLKRGQTDRNPTETPSRHLWRARLFRYDGS